ncbi:tRNA (adenosine(37)-N6)-dimethylallyltransferase MiaA [Siminovitchia fortis]|uniref:tRNA dimethylallyltransferase n=1 Tax=Siminovitchia fortis TaxID=254758 RepID=A0A443IU50_9BACI|nr:tRNA (adenosine(37)-N6)-dimethylallyltransferase MiaA [Siminovitchia fortis]RWR11637.1 tRNA (adenosine(37)-N6)-dimethylallyltransferase MiaA [Siminovitchia fortis]WHY83235.1 tRNA (adenosine(37)-N6)-dimethylallyltransferase MiaA [Siminovitchia fortis]
MNSKKKLIVLVGPTAVGKTKASIEIAKAFGSEIISGDSMQVYKGMDIGTAKIRPEEMEGIPHHLLDIREPDEPFSVAEFQSVVRQKIDEITARGSVPLIVGGTGLYVQSVLYDYRFTETEGDPAYRSELEKRAAAGEGAELYKELQAVDPSSAEGIHPNNVKRVIRALEIHHLTGKRKSDQPKAQNHELLYDIALIGLSMDREKLYKRINKRVDLMMEEGLLEEARYFYDKGIRDTQSVQAIGYKELYEYFAGNLTLEQAVDLLKKNTRRYAKRQFTWFRNKMDVTWFDMTNEGEHLNKIEQIIDFIAGKLELKSNT